MKMRDMFSVDRRRRRWKPKPIALVILGVALLVIVSGLVWGISRIRRGAPIAPVSTSSPGPSPGETTIESAPTAIVTPTVTAAHPVTWTVRLDRDPEGRIVGVVADPAVQQAVRQDFLEAWEWLFASQTPHNLDDLDLYFAPLPPSDDPVFQPGTQWWYGLGTVEEDLTQWENTGLLPQTVVEDGSWDVAISRFSTDGARVVVEAQYREGTCRVRILDANTGTVAGEGESRCMRYVAGLIYATDGRWKIASMWQESPNNDEEE